MATVLRDKFGSVETICRQDDAISTFLQHATHKFADADRVIGDDDNTFVLDAVDRFGRNAALGNCRGARRKNARRARGGLQRPPLAWLGCNHAIQIDQQYQAAVRSNRSAGEYLYAAKIFAEALDHDFIFAENFLNNQTDLPV